MIRQIQGKVLGIEPAGIIVEVAGFGLFVHTASPEAFPLGSTAILATHLAVKQDGLELYGFTSTADRDFFEITISVSGIGPKKGLMILTRAPRENLENALAKRDLEYLTRVAGLGKKTAEKMVVELSEKMHAKDGLGGGEDAEVFDTLVALGYTDREARKALGSIPKNISGKEARLRAALSNGGS